MQITLLDGGTGQEIYRRSKLTEAPLWSVEAMLNEPEIVTQVHQDFIVAGSEICTLNTYTATPTRLRDTKHKDDLKLIHDLATQSLEAAIKSSGQPVKIAGCLPDSRQLPRHTSSNLRQPARRILPAHPIEPLGRSLADRDHDESCGGERGRERRSGNRQARAPRLPSREKWQAQIGPDTG